MRLYFGCIQLDFVAEFSNVLIVHITCKTGPMLPDLKLNLQELVRIHVEFVIYLNCNCIGDVGNHGTDCEQSDTNVLQNKQPACTKGMYTIYVEQNDGSGKHGTNLENCSSVH